MMYVDVRLTFDRPDGEERTCASEVNSGLLEEFVA